MALATVTDTATAKENASTSILVFSYHLPEAATAITDGGETLAGRLLSLREYEGIPTGPVTQVILSRQIP